MIYGLRSLEKKAAARATQKWLQWFVVTPTKHTAVLMLTGHVSNAVESDIRLLGHNGAENDSHSLHDNAFIPRQARMELFTLPHTDIAGTG